MKGQGTYLVKGGKGGRKGRSPIWERVGPGHIPCQGGGGG